VNGSEIKYCRANHYDSISMEAKIDLAVEYSISLRFFIEKKRMHKARISIFHQYPQYDYRTGIKRVHF